MPIAKRKVDPAVMRDFYRRQGRSAAADSMQQRIDSRQQTKAEKLSARSQANRSLMVESGLCKCVEA